MSTHCNTPQHTATHCNTLQHTAKQWRAPIPTIASFIHISERTATHCNTLQHTAPYCRALILTTCIIHSYVWHDWVICVTSLIHMCNVSRDLFICGTTCLIQTSDRHIYLCDVILWYVWCVGVRADIPHHLCNFVYIQLYVCLRTNGTGGCGNNTQMYVYTCVTRLIHTIVCAQTIVWMSHVTHVYTYIYFLFPQPPVPFVLIHMCICIHIYTHAVQLTATHCSILHHTATYCGVLQFTATTGTGRHGQRKHAATHCNT